MKAERRSKGSKPPKADHPAKASKPMKTIRMKIPAQIYRQIETLVQQGWFRSEEDIIDEALRRFVNSHRPELLERSLLDEVDRVLHGKA